MKKNRFLLGLIIFSLLFSVAVFADDYQSELYREQLEVVGGGELLDMVPPGVAENAQTEPGLDIEKVSSLINPLNIFGNLINYALDSVMGLLSALSLLLAAILLASVFGALSTDAPKALRDVVNVVTVLSITMTAFGFVNDAYIAAQAAMNDMIIFASSLMPVIYIIMASSGAPVSAGAIQAVMIVAIDIVSRFNLRFCLPLLEIYTVLCLVGSISPQVRLSGIATFIKKAVTFFMGFVLTIFVGALSLQGVLTSAADSATVRVMKFTVGSLVPVVGGVLGEALNTVLGAAGLLRTTVGIFGIGVMLYIALPVMVSVVLRMIVLHIASLVAMMLGQENAGAFLKDLSGALSITFAILATVSALFIMSVAVTASLGGVK